MDKEEINSSYKSLQKVEHAFRVTKSMLDIRPVFVRKEARIRGHVMIIFFALLIETLIEKKLKSLFPEADNGDKKWVKQIIRNGEESLSMMTLYEELGDIRLIPLEFKSNNEKSVKATYITTKIDSNVKKLLSALGVKNSMHPEKLSFSRRNIKGDGQQMMMDFGVEHLI